MMFLLLYTKFKFDNKIHTLFKHNRTSTTTLTNSDNFTSCNEVIISIHSFLKQITYYQASNLLIMRLLQCQFCKHLQILVVTYIHCTLYYSRFRQYQEKPLCHYRCQPEETRNVHNAMVNSALALLTHF